MKRILALMLALLFVFGTFTACGIEDFLEQETETKTEADESDTESGTEAEIESETTPESESETESAIGCGTESETDSNETEDNGTEIDGTETGSRTDTETETSTETETDGNGNDSDKDYIRNGDKIIFGSYPQSKVTDEALTATLTSKAGTLPTSDNSQAWTSYGYYMEGEVQDYMWYIDVYQEGERYRGVYFTSYRSIATIHNYDSNQDDNGYTIGNIYWFKYEPVSWTVLSENTIDGTALILCDMIIDSQEYYIVDNGTRTIDGNTIYPNNYAQSTIRNWINKTFYSTAFNELEKQIILITEVDNSGESTGSDSNNYACENTEDKIFLLSYRDVLDSNYGFASSDSVYDIARQKDATDYAKVNGVYISSNEEYADNGYWWLRSADYNHLGYACVVDYYGGANLCPFVYGTSGGIVPALQIKL